MKHPKKRFVSALLAVAMVITCFLSFGGVKAAALPSGYASESAYYFYDCYPIVKEVEAAASFMLDSVVFDGQNVTAEEFNALVDSGYFSSIGAYSVFIIDIKTFLPDQARLASVFQMARSSGCMTILAATYTEAQIAGTTLNDNLDLYFQTSLVQMEDFVKGALTDLLDIDDDLTGTCFLIDDNMVNLPAQQISPASLCTSSPFFRILIFELACELGIQTTPELPESIDDVTTAMYSQIAQKLYQEHNIRFLVHRTGTAYRNLYNWQTISSSTAANLQTLMAPSGTRLCAFGFWELATPFYNFLYAGQQSLGVNNLPVYVFEIDPIVYGDSGLIVTTDSAYSTFDERNAFVAAVLSVLEELQ